MNLAKLIAKGRVEPIEKTDGAGILWLVGYRRKRGSRKHGEYWLNTPVKVETTKAAA